MGDGEGRGGRGRGVKGSREPQVERKWMRIRDGKWKIQAKGKELKGGRRMERKRGKGNKRVSKRRKRE